MDQSAAEQIIDEFLASLESLETQCAAALLFLKSTKGVTDANLAPFLEEAAKGSDVRRRAARARIGRLLSAAMKSNENEKGVKDVAKEKSGNEPDADQAQHSPTKAEVSTHSDTKDQQKTQDPASQRTQEQPSREERPSEKPGGTTKAAGSDATADNEEKSESSQYPKAS